MTSIERRRGKWWGGEEVLVERSRDFGGGALAGLCLRIVDG